MKQRALIIEQSVSTIGRAHAKGLNGEIQIKLFHDQPNQEVTDMEISVSTAYLNTRERRENALINISTPDGRIWSGTPAELLEVVFKPKADVTVKKSGGNIKQFLKKAAVADLYEYIRVFVVAPFLKADYNSAVNGFNQIPLKRYKKQTFQYLALDEVIGGITAFDYFFQYL